MQLHTKIFPVFQPQSVLTSMSKTLIWTGMHLNTVELQWLEHLWDHEN